MGGRSALAQAVEQTTRRSEARRRIRVDGEGTDSGRSLFLLRHRVLRIPWTPRVFAPHTSPVIKIELLLGFATFALWVYCLVDVISTPEGAVRNLQKVLWLLIVLLFPFVGSIAWLVAGRPQNGPRAMGAYERHAPAYPEYDRPGRAAALDEGRDSEFLEGVRARAEEQRTRHEQARRERERLAEEERLRYRANRPVGRG